jgi:alpha-galactosidase
MRNIQVFVLLIILFSNCIVNSILAQTDEKIILTPMPGLAPRINGAKVFGVRPGSPFLFTIPVTGERPLEYKVQNLPEGLKLNAVNGQITGKLTKKGIFQLTFEISNKYGRSESKFRIVCGDTLALTPYMGWNSWYVWENHVTDKIVRAAADAMIKSDMINHGFTYINIDDCWAVKSDSRDSSLIGTPRNKDGQINANPRFPDMNALTEYIHSLGLKAGIYTSPGPFTCAGHTGSYQHEQQDVQKFAEWGFDFLKYDWCSYGDMTKDKNNLNELEKPYSLVSGILKEQHRDIVLNICQYGMGNVWEWGARVGGNSWRTAGDLGGSFNGIAKALFRDGFDLYSTYNLQDHCRPGEWNDPDYLLLGYLSNWQGETVPTPLTPNEQYSHVSLWCLLAAPLIFSGDITRMDDFTLSLLTNDEVIELDQDPIGKAARRVSRVKDLEVWVKDMEDGSKAVGLFNRSGHESQVSACWSDLKINGKQKLRDLWRQKDMGIFENQFTADVPSHGVILIRLWSVSK